MILYLMSSTMRYQCCKYLAKEYYLILLLYEAQSVLTHSLTLLFPFLYSHYFYFCDYQYHRYINGDMLTWKYQTDFLGEPSFLRIRVSGEGTDLPLKMIVDANGEYVNPSQAFDYDRML